MSSIGERLQLVQEELGMTQRAMADAADIHFKSLNNYLKGRTFPDSRFLERLCREFNISPTWILLGEGAMIEVDYGLPKKAIKALLKAYAWIGQSKRDIIRSVLSVLLSMERGDRFEKLYDQIGPKKVSGRVIAQIAEVSRRMELKEWEVLTIYCLYRTSKTGEQHGIKTEIFEQALELLKKGGPGSSTFFADFQSRLADYKHTWKTNLELREFQ